MVASPICGTLAAGYLTVPALHYIKSIGLPLPPDEHRQRPCRRFPDRRLRDVDRRHPVRDYCAVVQAEGCRRLTVAATSANVIAPLAPASGVFAL